MGILLGLRLRLAGVDGEGSSTVKAYDELLKQVKSLPTLEVLIEELAALEHEQWSAWASSLIQNETLSRSRVDRWGRLLVPYGQLTDEEKEQDRIWARKALAILNGKITA